MFSRKRDLSINLRLLVLAAGIVLPLTAFGGFLLVRYAEDERTKLETDALQSVHGLALDVERELAAMTREAKLIAASSSRLQAGDLEGFHRQARAAAGVEGNGITISDMAGRELVDSAVDYGQALPMLADLGRPKAAFAADGPRLTGITTGPVSQLPIIAIDTAIRNAENGVPYLLSIALDPAVFQRILDAQHLPSEWLGAIADASGRLIARNVDADNSLGRLLAPEFLAQAAGRKGAFTNHSRDNVLLRSSFERLAGSDWIAVIAVPQQLLATPLRNSLLLVAFVALGALLLAASVALWTGWVVARPMRDLAQSALAIAVGARPQMPASGLREISAAGALLLKTYDVLQQIESEKQVAERRLRDSEAERHEALDAAEIGTWSIKLPSRERFWDANLRHLFGIALDAPATPEVLQSVVHPADLDRYVAGTNEIFGGQTSHGLDFRIIAPDNTVRWLRLKGGVSLRDGQGNPVVAKGVVMNIDTLKQGERELKESEDRYRGIVESATDAFVVIDIEGRVQSFNRAAESMLGYAAAEVVGKNVNMLMPSADAARHDGHIKRYLRTGEARIIGVGREVEARRKDGSLFPADLAIVEWRAGGVPYFTGVLRDITQRRDAEAAQAKLEAQLLQAQKMEAVGQLTGGIAHDFNNLLLAISLNLEALDEDSTDRPAAKPLIDGAILATGQARSLIGQLLAFGRRQRLDSRTFDVNAVIADTVGILRRTVEANITIETVLPEKIWPVFADRQQLERAVLNLAVNARDALPGGGRLVIETGNETIESKSGEENQELAPGSYTVISLSDTGTGMSPEVVARAFEPFYTTKKIGDGTGLGLSQVYGYAKQSGGHVVIFSELGRGTTVKLYLPRSTEILAPTDKAVEARSVPGHGETILMVEDTPLVRSAVKRMLMAIGYRVIDVANGNEAVAELRRDAGIDLLFTDMVLPGGMGGIELAREARLLRPALRILLTSGYTRMRVLPKGPDGSTQLPLISKPYTKAELAERLVQIFNS